MVSGIALVEACRRRRLPLTQQRRIVFEALALRYDHPTADQMFRAVRRRLPGISRATVYRALEDFVRWGVARKISSARRGARFDGNVRTHHHLLCLRCDRMVDCEERGPRIPRQKAGFRIHDYSVVFRGICSTCRRKERSYGSSRIAGPSL